jgi:F420-dependent oxidoreductase-like protein
VVGFSHQEIKLGTAIVQMSARQPAATAMAAMTLDHLSGGRFILGLGVSGPQVVEGWYGMPFAKPLARTREYVSILRDIWARRGPVQAPGPHYQLPLPDGTGLGKPLKASIHPLREDIPIYLGAEGPKNIALAAELCDGWLALFFRQPTSTSTRARCRRIRREARRGARTSRRATVPFIFQDLDAAADSLRLLALYGGWVKGTNFHANVRSRWVEREVEIAELYLSRKKTRHKIPRG